VTDGLPIITVDMDGVFCRPFFGWNIGIHREFLDPDAPPPEANIPNPRIGPVLDQLRFNPRRPIPGAREALAQLAEVRRVMVLTGRRTVPRWWLRRYGFEGLFENVIVNRTARKSPHYKLETIQRLGVSEHVDDDPRTAQLLAQRTDARIFLVDWPRNRDLPFHPAVERVPDLATVVERLQ